MEARNLIWNMTVAVSLFKAHLFKKINYLLSRETGYTKTSEQYNCYTYMHTEFSRVPEEIHGIIAAYGLCNKSLGRSKSRCGHVL